MYVHTGSNRLVTIPSLMNFHSVENVPVLSCKLKSNCIEKRKQSQSEITFPISYSVPTTRAM